jgi:hypothetical protein
MTGNSSAIIPDLYADPFGERVPVSGRRSLRLLGSQVEFKSNSRALLGLVDSAYEGLPRHRLSKIAPRLRIRLVLTSAPPPRRRGEPPPVSMVAGAGFLGGATDTSSFVVISPETSAALVVVSPQMLRSAYHTRYELIEFAVFTLAARVQNLVSLHAACVSKKGRGLLLMGASGAGKSTVSLQCLLQGFEFLSEDSVFVAPETLLATGVPNFVHVRAESVRWINHAKQAAAIRKSPVIRRRSGVRKFEVDLRRGGYQLAARPPKIAAVIFLSELGAAGRPLLIPLSRSETLRRLSADQAYAAAQPPWASFIRNIASLDVFELRRGLSPLESVEALDRYLEFGVR